MNLANIRAGLTDLFIRMSGLASAGADNESPLFSDDTTQATLTFRLTSIVGLGKDEYRVEFDTDAIVDGDTFDADPDEAGVQNAGGLIISYTGNRKITCSVKVECGRQDVTANEYVERVRDKIRLPSNRARLKMIGLAVNSISATRDLNYIQDNREMSVSQLDIIFNAASGVSDDPVTTIESIDLSVENT